MKLPLDHFRLLGVKPETSRLEIEQILMERLRKPPSEGYSLDTLNARAELLQASGTLLMDERFCKSHEQQVETTLDGGGFSGIELEPGQQIAAPLLLLEAQDNLKAFKLALELLSCQENSAPLHGDQQEDLLLMAALAARRTSQQMWAKRLYDQSAQVLERAIQLLGKYASQTKRKATLEDDLNKIAPFRILDLLSQEHCTEVERQRGLNSLKALIDHRGGLDAEDDEQRSPIVFQDFFKEIRSYLTIDEQLELFEHYSRQKVLTATFLLAYTRAAAGFQRRQPAHIDAALVAMEALNAEGLEPEKACLLLLLGQPDAAQDMVKSCQDPQLCQWLASSPSPSDTLLGLCKFCSQWLDQQVLPCYRDVDPHAKVDLDAYFLDSEVQRYIKNRDSLAEPSDDDKPLESKQNGETNIKQTKDLALFTPTKSTEHTSPSQQVVQPEPSPVPAINQWSDMSKSSVFMEETSSSQSPDEPPNASPPTRVSKRKAMNFTSTLQQRQTVWPLAAKGALAVGITVALVALRPWSMLTTTRTSIAPPPPALAPLVEAPILFDRAAIRAVQEAEVLDLAGVKTLLSAWLSIKSVMLNNNTSTHSHTEMLGAIALLAVPEQVKAVQNQYQDLRERGERLQVRSQLGNMSLLSQSPEQVRARVDISYTEATINAAGVVTNTFGPTVLGNEYTFIRGQQGWQLLRFSPASS